jgi:hypothetical protein
MNMMMMIYYILYIIYMSEQYECNKEIGKFMLVYVLKRLKILLL